MAEYSSIAIIVPTLNRQPFLLRTVEYYVHLNLSLNLFVGDSTHEALQIPARLRCLIRQSSLNLFYYHIPGLNDRQAISYLAEQVNSCGIDFIAFHGDDDYFVPETLLECSNFLDINPEYTSAQGCACTISLHKAGPYGALTNITKYWHAPSLQAQCPVQRLNDFADSYFVLQFSVHRTREFLNSCFEYQHVPDSLWAELFHGFYLALQGKSYFLDKLYLVRHAHPAIYHKPFATWITSYSSSCGMVFFVDKLSAAFNMTLEDRALLISAIERCLCLTLNRKFSRSFHVAIPRLPLRRMRASWFRFLLFVDRSLFPIPCSRSSFFYYFRRIMTSFSVQP